MHRTTNGRNAPAHLAFALVILTDLGGCATSQADIGAPAPGDLGEARWVETTPDVRTLLVTPDRICEVALPGEDAATLAIGSFFARYDSPAGPIDQLAIMVVLEGEPTAGILQSGMSLTLEIDGEMFVGQPGLGSNSVSWDPSNDGKATLAIPISPDVLEALAGAETVRGRVGSWATFDFPTETRDRLQHVLRGLPEDFRPQPQAGSVRALQAIIAQ